MGMAHEGECSINAFANIIAIAVCNQSGLFGIGCRKDDPSQWI